MVEISGLPPWNVIHNMWYLPYQLVSRISSINRNQGSGKNGCIWNVLFLPLEIHPFSTEPWWWEEGYTPEIWHKYQKWWFGKCISFNTWLFRVSLLRFRGVTTTNINLSLAAKSDRIKDWSTGSSLSSQPLPVGCLAIEFSTKVSGT